MTFNTDLRIFIVIVKYYENIIDDDKASIFVVDNFDIVHLPDEKKVKSEKVEFLHRTVINNYQIIPR